MANRDECIGPKRLSAYYSGAGIVPDGTIGFPKGVSTVIPGSGRIAISNFYGAQVPVDSFFNGDFEITTPISDLGNGVIQFPGWKIYLKHVKLNGRDTILNYATPMDANVPPKDRTQQGGLANPWPPGQDQDDWTPDATKCTWNWELIDLQLPNNSSFAIPGQGGRYIMRLYHNGNLAPNQGYGILRGPYIVSDDDVDAKVGDRVVFHYRAKNGQDAFDIFAYLIDERNGKKIILLDATDLTNQKETAWIKVEREIFAGEEGIYRFIFISGSWDYSGGKALGASLYIDNVNLERAGTFVPGPQPTTTTTIAGTTTTTVAATTTTTVAGTTTTTVAGTTTTTIAGTTTTTVAATTTTTTVANTPLTVSITAEIDLNSYTVLVGKPVDNGRIIKGSERGFEITLSANAPFQTSDLGSQGRRFLVTARRLTTTTGYTAWDVTDLATSITRTPNQLSHFPDFADGTVWYQYITVTTTEDWSTSPKKLYFWTASDNKTDDAGTFSDWDIEIFTWRIQFETPYRTVTGPNNPGPSAVASWQSATAYNNLKNTYGQSFVNLAQRARIIRSAIIPFISITGLNFGTITKALTEGTTYSYQFNAYDVTGLTQGQTIYWLIDGVFPTPTQPAADFVNKNGSFVINRDAKGVFIGSFSITPISSDAPEAQEDFEIGFYTDSAHTISTKIYTLGQMYIVSQSASTTTTTTGSTTTTIATTINPNSLTITDSDGFATPVIVTSDLNTSVNTGIKFVTTVNNIRVTAITRVNNTPNLGISWSLPSGGLTLTLGTTLFAFDVIRTGTSGSAASDTLRFTTSAGIKDVVVNWNAVSFSITPSKLTFTSAAGIVPAKKSATFVTNSVWNITVQTVSISSVPGAANSTDYTGLTGVPSFSPATINSFVSKYIQTVLSSTIAGTYNQTMTFTTAGGLTTTLELEYTGTVNNTPPVINYVKVWNTFLNAEIFGPAPFGVNEGYKIAFKYDISNRAGRTLYWGVGPYLEQGITTPVVTNADFTAPYSGTITNDTGVIEILATADDLLDQPQNQQFNNYKEYFRFYIYSDSSYSSSSLIGQSPTCYIEDTSRGTTTTTTVTTPSTPSITAGSWSLAEYNETTQKTVYYNITVSDTSGAGAPRTVYWQIYSSTGVVAADFDENTLIGTFSSAVGSVNRQITFNIKSDSLTEGSESFGLKFYINSARTGTPFYDSGTVNILDTSVAGNFTFGLDTGYVASIYQDGPAPRDMTRLKLTVNSYQGSAQYTFGSTANGSIIQLNGGGAYLSNGQSTTVDVTATGGGAGMADVVAYRVDGETNVEVARYAVTVLAGSAPVSTTTTTTQNYTVTLFEPCIGVTDNTWTEPAQSGVTVYWRFSVTPTTILTRIYDFTNSVYLPGTFGPTNGTQNVAGQTITNTSGVTQTRTYQLRLFTSQNEVDSGVYKFARSRSFELQIGGAVVTSLEVVNPSLGNAVVYGPYTVHEGNQITFRYNISNRAGRSLYWTIYGAAGVSDLSPYSGTINNDTDNITITATADLLTEGNETWNLGIYSDSGYTTLLKSIGPISVIDTSVSATTTPTPTTSAPVTSGPTASASVSPSAITANYKDTATVTWSSTNATNLFVSINGQAESEIPLSGSQSFAWDTPGTLTWAVRSRSASGVYSSTSTAVLTINPVAGAYVDSGSFVVPSLGETTCVFYTNRNPNFYTYTFAFGSSTALAYCDFTLGTWSDRAINSADNTAYWYNIVTVVNLNQTTINRSFTINMIENGTTVRQRSFVVEKTQSSGPVQ